MGNSTTIKDVAAAAGVSEATVSYVVNGKAAKVGIPAGTQAQVLEVARRLGYLPNPVAREMALGHLSSGCETLALPHASLESALTAEGYHLVPVASVEELARLAPEGLVGAVYRLPKNAPPPVAAPEQVTVGAPVVAPPGPLPAAKPAPVITVQPTPGPVVDPVPPTSLPVAGDVASPSAVVLPVAVPIPPMEPASVMSTPDVPAAETESVPPPIPTPEPEASAETGSPVALDPVPVESVPTQVLEQPVVVPVAEAEVVPEFAASMPDPAPVEPESVAVSAEPEPVVQAMAEPVAPAESEAPVEMPVQFELQQTPEAVPVVVEPSGISGPGPEPESVPAAMVPETAVVAEAPVPTVQMPVEPASSPVADPGVSDPISATEPEAGDPAQTSTVIEEQST